MKLEFHEYEAHKLVDGPGFWGKNTAHPYVGCGSGCEFCYARSSRYLGRRDPNTFDALIGAKTNSAKPLHREIIFTGDWQQLAEDRCQLSRAMLRALCEYGFPRYFKGLSPLLTRDLGLLVDINRRSWAGVAFSISTLDPALKRTFEPRSPRVKRRLQAMAQLAAAGIQVGAQ